MTGRRHPWEVPRIVAGMERQLASRAEMLASGARPIGWKLAFGTGTAMDTLGLRGPVIGFLTDVTQTTSGAEVAIAGWSAPKLEVEIAIYLGPGGTGVAAIGPAIELADADRPPTEIEEVVAGDIYHRGVVLGDAVDRPGGPITVRIDRGGDGVAVVEDAESVVGKLDELAAYVVDYLRHFRIVAREGDVIISGSVVPLIDIAPGEAWRSQVERVGSVEIRIT